MGGTWTISQVAGNNSSIAADTTWVGIGGESTRDLIQVGTQAITSSNGQVDYQSWYELLPDNSIQIPITVNAGDSVTASIIGESNNQWLITFRNNTNNQSYSTTVNYNSSLSSAEWIEEMPVTVNGRLVPLDNFGTVQFTNGFTVKNNTQVNISQSGAKILTMINTIGQALATPSSLNIDGGSFSVARSSIAIATSPLIRLSLGRGRYATSTGRYSWFRYHRGGRSLSFRDSDRD